MFLALNARALGRAGQCPLCGRALVGPGEGTGERGGVAESAGPCNRCHALAGLWARSQERRGAFHPAAPYICRGCFPCRREDAVELADGDVVDEGQLFNGEVRISEVLPDVCLGRFKQGLVLAPCGLLESCKGPEGEGEQICTDVP